MTQPEPHEIAPSALTSMSRAARLALKRELAARCAELEIPLSDTTSPGQLALKHDPNQVQRPHLEAIDDVFIRLLAEPNRRQMIFIAPQTGKSSRCSRWAPFWWHTNRPKDRIVLGSYASSLAVTHGAATRDLVTMYGDEYGLRLRDTENTKAAWMLRTGGSMRSVGVRGGLTGQPMDFGIIDDPVSNREQAESPVIREATWDWYSSVWSTRKSPQFREVLIMCMTGDTPVLMADGTERPLRDIRPGDHVATYENGSITTTFVREWANQGPDSIYRIRMKSGREVRANARHPFLTIDENGHEAWKRTNTIEPGNVILGIGASGAECPARPTDANSPRNAGACARHTTTSSTGRLDVEGPHQRSNARRECGTATGSLPTSSTPWSSARTDSAQSADNHQTPPTPGLTGAESSASTTTTTPAGSADCCATTAISQSDTESRRTSCVQPPTTYSVTPDEVLDVVPCGSEDVFDVQIDRTENFIANGLVSHNTRFHKDDLAGRLLAQDGRVEEGGAWHVLHLPTIALAEDREKGIYPDALGREPGEPITHPRIDPTDIGGLLAHWGRARKAVTNRDWNALYQGLPFDAEGALLSADDVRAATKPAPDEWRRTVVAVDPSGGGRDTAGIVVVSLDAARKAWFRHDATAVMSSDVWSRKACEVAVEFDATRIVVEKNFGGDMAKTLVTQAWAALQAEGAIPPDMLCPLVTEVVARKSKVLRAEPIAQAIKTGRCSFVAGAELKQLTDEWLMWEPGTSWSPGALDAGVYGAVEVLPALPRGAGVANPASRSRSDAPRGGGVASRRIAG